MTNTLEDVQFESRLKGALLAFVLAGGMMMGGLWILSGESITGKVARLSSYPQAIAIVWMLLALLVLPYFLNQVCNCLHDYQRQVVRLACRAVLAGGVIWVYLAWLSRNLDFQYITLIFVINGLSAVGMAAVLAHKLNRAQQHAQGGAA